MAEEVEPLPGASAGATAPGAAGLGRAVDKAKGAAEASDANAVGYTDTLAIDQLISDVGGTDFRRRR